MADKSLENGWNYLDLWDMIPDSSNYTNSAIHLTPAGEAILAKRLEQAIETQSCP
jgi:lysophospholipase L1-like esterase